MTLPELETVFTYHKPTTEQILKLAEIREAGMQLAVVVLENTPPSADQSAAIRFIRQAVMTANAAVVLDGK